MPLRVPSPLTYLKTHYHNYKYNRISSTHPDPENEWQPHPQPQRQLQPKRKTTTSTTLSNQENTTTKPTPNYLVTNLSRRFLNGLRDFALALKSFKRIEGNVTPWILSTLFFALLVMVVSVGKGGKWGRGQCGKGGGGETEMERTDWVLGIPRTTVVPVSFIGSPTFDDDGGMNIASESPRYMGDPSPEIDEAWEALEGGRYFAITEREAKGLWGEGYMEFEDKSFGGFTAGLDIFHGLHCINQIRKALHAQSYPPPSKILEQDNIIPCLTHLRQMIQCSGDTTPNPTRYYEGIRQNYVDLDRVHSCRDWEGIRQWGWERFNGSLMVDREGVGGIDEEAVEEGKGMIEY